MEDKKCGPFSFEYEIVVEMMTENKRWKDVGCNCETKVYYGKKKKKKKKKQPLYLENQGRAY